MNFVIFNQVPVWGFVSWFFSCSQNVNSPGFPPFWREVSIHFALLTWILYSFPLDELSTRQGGDCL